MKELSKSFVGEGQVRGYEYTQVKASDSGYIYRVSDGFSHDWYEVFRRKENTRFGCMSYPGENAFGKWAWTKMTKKSAELLLVSFERKRDQQPSKINLPNIPASALHWKQLSLFDALNV